MEKQKLQPHEKPLYQKTFAKHKDMGCATEFAHEQAVLAVKLWNEVGAFDVEPKVGSEKFGIDLQPAWNCLGEILHGCSGSSTDWEERLATAMLDFQKGEMSLIEFKQELDLIFHDPNE